MHEMTKKCTSTVLRKMAGRGTDEAQKAIDAVNVKEKEDRQRQMEREEQEYEYWDAIYDCYRDD